MSNGMGGHQSLLAMKYEWLTPPEIIKSLGEFDLDPCAPVTRPWETAKHHYTIHDDGLLLNWFGRVWLNPPYGSYLNTWMQKMAMHNHGIALTFARTETKTFHHYIFPVADSIHFLEGRLFFHNRDGSQAKWNGGAPSVLIAYGENNSEAIAQSKIPGKHILLNRASLIIISNCKTWKLVVHTALVNLNRQADLDSIYEMVEKIAPEKVNVNQHYKAKVRQTLQLYFSRIKRGEYSSN